MSDIWDLARQLGAKIIFFKPNEEITKDGMYYKDLDTVCLNDTVSTMRQENVLLHEIGHSFYGHEHFQCHSKGRSFKQEKQAEEYVLHYRAEQWLAAYDWEPHCINYRAFMEHFELASYLYNSVVKIFKEILQSENCVGHY